jgi:preprotein translocase subunit SecE
MADDKAKKADNKEKEKKLNEKNSKRAAASKKPKRSIVQYFKDAKAEFKKVTWPTPKQVVNNTAVVLTMLVVAGAAIFGVDTLLEMLFNLILLRE